MDPLSVLIFLGILSLSALFSGTETAITAVSGVTVTRLAGEGNPAARLLQRMLMDKGRVIAALLVANNIVNVILAVYATVVIDESIRGAGWLPQWAAPIVASVCSVIFLLVFGEVMPKSIAVHFRNRWALTSAWFVLVLMFLTRPLTWLLMRFSDLTMRAMGARPGEEDPFDLREIATVAQIGEQAGVIDPMEKQLIQRAAQLNDTRVREIMVPRTDMRGLEIGTPLEEIRAVFQRTPFTRLPVYKEDFDDIVGVLNFKEFLRLDPTRARGFDLTAYLHKPLFVPESMFIGDLLNEMRRQRTHIAIVLDEYGGTAGLITLEDAVEMLVGRIEDEYDIVSTPFEQLDADTWEVDGRVIDERLVSRLGLALPPEALEGFDTVAGLALRAFGNIPSEGDTTTYHDIEITATRVKGHRVRRVRVRKLTPEELAARAQESPGASARRKITRQVQPEGTGAAAAAAEAGEEEGSKSLDQPREPAAESTGQNQEARG